MAFENPSSGDRTHPDIYLGFPDEPLWTGLLESAKRITDPVLNDTTLGAEITLAQLLHDVVAVRRALWEQLPPSLFEPTAGGGSLINASAPYIGLSTRPNYEFYVAALAILSVGGAIVRVRNSDEENLQVLRECQVSGILAGPQQLSPCQTLAALGAAQGYPIRIIPLHLPSLTTTTSPPKTSNTTPFTAIPFHINPSQPIPATRPALVIRTTGTTGGPKSAVHTRALFYRTMPGQPGDLTLIHESLVWISGSVSIMLRVLSGGGRGEVLPTEPGPAAIWDRLRRGGVTRLTDHAWFWERLAEYYMEHIAGLEAGEREGYVQGARGLRSALVTGSAPPPWLMRWWKGEFGRELVVGFVATELGEVALMTSEGDEYFEGALGRPFTGATVKLSDGDHGELLVKTQHLFSHYIGDPDKTRRAFDKEGYFKTGDLAHLEGDTYVFDGRLGSDIIRVGSKDISLVRLDNELIAGFESAVECCTVCIPAEDSPGTPVLGVIMRFRGQAAGKDEQKTRENILLQVETRLASVDVPTRVRVLRDAEEIPRTFNMKPFRRVAVQKYFAD